MRSGRGRCTLEAPLDLKRSCDFAALWDLDRGSGRTRRHTQHRIRPGDPCWNVHVYRGKPCRQARALGRSHSERCILTSKDLFSRYFVQPLRNSLSRRKAPSSSSRNRFSPVDTRLNVSAQISIARSFQRSPRSQRSHRARSERERSRRPIMGGRCRAGSAISAALTQARPFVYSFPRSRVSVSLTA